MCYNHFLISDCISLQQKHFMCSLSFKSLGAIYELYNRYSLAIPKKSGIELYLLFLNLYETWCIIIMKYLIVSQHFHSSFYKILSSSVQWSQNLYFLFFFKKLEKHFQNTKSTKFLSFLLTRHKRFLKN